MAYRSYSRLPAKRSRFPRWLLAVLPLLLIGGGLYWLLFADNKVEAPPPDLDSTQSVPEAQTPAYAAIDLQPTVDKWLARNSGVHYSIVVRDLQAQKNIAEHNPDEPIFAASLYKIFIAYLMYKDFQTGTQNPDEILSQGRTKRECADAMIRSSDSPCGEAAMANMGQLTLNQRVVDEIGTTSTFFNGIRTSAADSVKVLSLIAAKKDLNDEHTTALLDSMLTQEAKFKRGLQTGAPDAKWETKVGWNEDINYHDIGIMTMPDGRRFAVAILSKGQGSPRPIADFASTIYAALTQE